MPRGDRCSWPGWSCSRTRSCCSLAPELCTPQDHTTSLQVAHLLLQFLAGIVKCCNARCLVYLHPGAGSGFLLLVLRQSQDALFKVTDTKSVLGQIGVRSGEALEMLLSKSKLLQETSTCTPQTVGRCWQILLKL